MIKPQGTSDGMETAVVYLSMLEQLYDLWEENEIDKSVIAETVTAMIEIACLGRTTSDNKAIMRELRPYIRLSAKSRQKYREKCETTAETEIQKLQLEEIADLMNNGESGRAIAEKLDLKKSTVYNRMRKIKEEYPFLLDGYECPKMSNIDLDTVSKCPKDVGQKLDNEKEQSAVNGTSTSKNVKKVWVDDNEEEEFDF